MFNKTQNSLLYLTPKYEQCVTAGISCGAPFFVLFNSGEGNRVLMFKEPYKAMTYLHLGGGVAVLVSNNEIC